MARRDSPNRADPLLDNFFGIELKVSSSAEYNSTNANGAYFSKIEGGEMSIALIEHNIVYQNGSSSTLFIPGPSSFAPITLYQGVTADRTIWEWWSNVTKGKNVRTHASISVYGQKEKTGSPAAYPDRVEKARWNLEYVWPLSISGFSLDLDSPRAMVASITLVAESIERVEIQTDPTKYEHAQHWLR